MYVVKIVKIDSYGPWLDACNVQNSIHKILFHNEVVFAGKLSERNFNVTNGKLFDLISALSLRYQELIDVCLVGIMPGYS